MKRITAITILIIMLLGTAFGFVTVAREASFYRFGDTVKGLMLAAEQTRGEPLAKRLTAMGAELESGTDKRLSTLSDRAESGLSVSGFLLSFYGRLERLLGKRVSYDELYTTCLLSNGYMAYANKYINMTDYVKNLTDFADFLKARDTELLFVLNPSKAEGAGDMFPKGIVSYYDHIKGQVLNGVKAHGIGCIDMAKELEPVTDGDTCSLFFKTDHHWKPTSGLPAARVVAERLNRDYGYSFELSMLEPEQYLVKSFQNFFVGSQGKKMGIGFEAPEDFQIPIPKFETAFFVKIPSLEFNGAGNYQETMINTAVFKGYNYAEDNAYGAYLYGDHAQINIQNRSCHNGKRMLMVKTSLANVVVPLLACGDVEFIDVVDLRMYKDSLRDYVESTKPDTVIVMYGLPYYPANLKSTSCSWNFS